MADETYTTLTADIIAAYVSNNPVAANELPALIISTYGALSGATAPAAPAAPEDVTATPAQIRKSMTHEGLISFVDGKLYKSLKRHLGTHSLTPDTYRTKYGLPKDYPMVSPAYSAQRSALAKSLGLGLGRKAAADEPEVKSVRKGRKKAEAAE